MGNVDDGYIGSGTYFKNAVKKYGIENFERKILYFEYESRENLLKEEYLIIERVRAVSREEFYNQVNHPPPSQENISFQYSDSYIGKGKRWYNNGLDELRFYEKDVPDGWSQGRLFKVPGTKGKSWYNNGVINKMFEESDVPEGWIKGRLGASLYGEKNHFYGRKHSTETRQKIRQTKIKNSTIKRGKDNPAAVPLVIENVMCFDTIRQAAEFFGVDYLSFYGSYRRSKKYLKDPLYLKFLKIEVDKIKTENRKQSPFSSANKIYRKAKNENRK